MAALADTQAIAILLARPAATIRSWAHRGQLTRHGTDRRGRTMYDIGEAQQLAAQLAMVETPATLCNTERASGSMP
jgi:hypothetical protein